MDGQRYASRRAECYRIAHVLEFLDHGGGQGGEVDALGRLARTADPGEREDVVERAGDVLDRRRHLGALAFILDRFDPHAQRGKRRLKVMADRTEHDILLVEQRGDARFHRVVRGNQAPHVVRPVGGELAVGALRAGERLGPRGQRRERARDLPQQQEMQADQQDVDHQRLEQDRSHHAALTRRDRNARDHPVLGVAPFQRGDQHAAVLVAAGRQPRVQPGPVQDIGIARHRALDHDQFGDGDALIDYDRAQRLRAAGVNLVVRQRGEALDVFDAQRTREAIDQMPVGAGDAPALAAFAVRLSAHDEGERRGIEDRGLAPRFGRLP